MKVLLIKTSSMGDIVHTLPALTDAMRALPTLEVDWVVEEAFVDIAAAHPAVHNVIPCALRRWRKSPFKTWRSGEWANFKKRIRQTHYDLVIDAQGLAKSAFLTRLADGPKAGLDKRSAREPVAARVLNKPIFVPKGEHAIERVRQLFSIALKYELPESGPDYGLSFAMPENEKSVIFFHGTTWATKHWPESYWAQLATLAGAAGYRVLLPWGSDSEHAAAKRIAGSYEYVEVLPRLTLAQLFKRLQSVNGFVAVDTGLAHLAAGCGMPGVALYGPTDPVLTGVSGINASSMAATFDCAPCLKGQCAYKGALSEVVMPPCFSTLPPETVWETFMQKSQQINVAGE